MLKKESKNKPIAANELAAATAAKEHAAKVAAARVQENATNKTESTEKPTITDELAAAEAATLAEKVAAALAQVQAAQEQAKAAKAQAEAAKAQAEAVAAAERLRVRADRRAKASEKMMNYLTVPPPPPDFVWKGFLRGTAGGLIAAGSTGKSYLSIELGMCVASAVANAALLQLEIPVHGPVTIVNAEDPEQIVWERIHAIGKHMKPEDYKAMADNIEIVSLFGRAETDMMDASFLVEMLEYAHDTRLIIFDTLNRLAGTADENSNGEMGLLLKKFEFIASRANTGVLILHHSSKAASSNGQQHKQESSRGASAITSNLRWQGYMQCMTEDESKAMGVPDVDRHSYVRFGGNKENYGVKTSDIWLKRHDFGVLLPYDFAVQTKAAAEKKKAQAEKTAKTKRNQASEYAESLKTTNAQVLRAAAEKQAEIDTHVDPNAPFDAAFTTAEPYVKAKMTPQPKTSDAQKVNPKNASKRNYAKA
jgi:RecA-family ATPase